MFEVARRDWATKNEELERLSTEQLLEWGFNTFQSRLALASSFQAEASVLIDIAHRLRGGLDTEANLGLHQHPRRSVQQASRSGLSQHRMRAVHAGDQAMGGHPRRTMVVGKS